MPRLSIEPRHKLLQILQKCHLVFICLICVWTKAYRTL